MSLTLETLPVELITGILEHLDIAALRACSEVCPYLRDAVSNSWRHPIIRALLRHDLEPLKNLGELGSVPRHIWIDILCYASPDFLLFQATLPNIFEDDYQRAFFRRFPPSWSKIRKNGSWRSAFHKYLSFLWSLVELFVTKRILRMLYSVHHRLSTNCTTTEAWSNYIIIHRTGVANSTTSLSRTLDPLTLFNGLKSVFDS